MPWYWFPAGVSACTTSYLLLPCGQCGVSRVVADAYPAATCLFVCALGVSDSVLSSEVWGPLVDQRRVLTLPNALAWRCTTLCWFCVAWMVPAVPSQAVVVRGSGVLRRIGYPLRRIGYALPPEGSQAGADWLRLPVSEALSVTGFVSGGVRGLPRLQVARVQHVQVQCQHVSEHV